MFASRSRPAAVSHICFRHAFFLEKIHVLVVFLHFGEHFEIFVKYLSIFVNVRRSLDAPGLNWQGALSNRQCIMPWHRFYQRSGPPSHLDKNPPRYVFFIACLLGCLDQSTNMNYASKSIISETSRINQMSKT